MSADRINRKPVAAGQIPQTEHFSDAGSKKVLGDVLAVPVALITADTSAAPRTIQLPGEPNGLNGTLLRIRTTGTTYVAFGPDSTLTAPSSSTPTALELDGAGVFLVSATDNYVATSIAVARMEVLDA